MSRPAELVSPNQVIEEMSFSPSHKSKTERNPSHVPVAPPPACAPPPPPKSPKLLDRDEPDLKNSYGSTLLRGGVLRGDATVQPNTGRSNSALGEGTALHQVIWRMRLMNLMACSLAILFQIPWLVAKFFFNPAKAILGCYLIFFAGTLCCFELHSPIIDRFIDDNFGMLQHPLSRCVFLILLATLCVGGGGILEAVVGFVLLLNAIYTLSIYIRYPEYRQMHFDYQQSDLVDTWRRRATRYAWANPDAVSSILTRDEKQPLVG